MSSLVPGPIFTGRTILLSLQSWAVLLDQVGLHTEAARGYQVSVDLQDADGCWTYTQGWEHYVWGVSGFKAWAVMEHYRLTGDKGYLAAIYPRMAANSRWQERQRARTRKMVDGERPPHLRADAAWDGGLRVDGRGWQFLWGFSSAQYSRRLCRCDNGGGLRRFWGLRMSWMKCAGFIRGRWPI